MTNLFSIFDPYTIGSLPLNWISCFILTLLLPSKVWSATGRYQATLKTSLNSVMLEFSAILSNATPGGASVCMVFILTLILANILGLLPYVFTNSSHLVYCASVALPLWVGHMLMASTKSPIAVMSHLVPSGSPMALAPFMVLIELTSSVIRPLTLSVRLTANMVAGHLLLSLVSGPCPQASTVTMFAIYAALVALILLESAVALIQAYVFSILNTLYLKEVESNAMSL